MDGPYDEPWGVGAAAGSSDGASSAGEATTIAVVIVAEVVMISALLIYFWRRKKTQAQPMREDLMRGGHIQGPGVQRVYRGVIFVTIGMFAGLASLNLLQTQLMDEMEQNYVDANSGVPMPNKQSWETQFKHAASCNHIMNLVFRLAHNIVFACIVPRYRVYVSLLCMVTSMCMLGVGVYGFGAYNLLWVIVSYGLGGIAIGTFESNLLASISPLGHATKFWAIAGMPIGYAAISVLGYLAKSPPLSVPTMYLYYFVIMASGNGVIWWFAYIPPDAHSLSNTSNTNNLRTFREGVKALGEWLPLIKWNCLAYMVVMYAVTFFTRIPFYVYNDDTCKTGFVADPASCNEVSLIEGTGASTLMDRDRFFAVFSMHVFLGDAISRKVAYYFEPRNPMLYLFLAIVGAVMGLLRMPILLWPGLFAINFANGAVYATTTRFIDQQVHKDFNLIALSFWLFIGDAGAVLAANTWMYFESSSRFCDGAQGNIPGHNVHGWEHMCLNITHGVPPLH